MELYSVKDPTEGVVCTWDFTADIARLGGALTACVVDVLRVDGTVEDLTAMVSGVCDISANPVVTQKIVGGVHAVNYIVRFTATINGIQCVGSASMLCKIGA